MGPLTYVDWRKLNALFCALMWAVALVLGVYVLCLVVPQSSTVQHVVVVR